MLIGEINLGLENTRRMEKRTIHFNFNKKSWFEYIFSLE